MYNLKQKLAVGLVWVAWAALSYGVFHVSGSPVVTGISQLILFPGACFGMFYAKERLI